MPAQVIAGGIDIVAAQVTAATVDVHNWALTIGHKISEIDLRVLTYHIGCTIDFIVIDHQHICEEKQIKSDVRRVDTNESDSSFLIFKLTQIVQEGKRGG